MTHLIQAAQQELPEPAGVLDLTEDRFDGDLAQTVAAVVMAAHPDVAPP